MAKDRTYTAGHISLRVDGKLAKTGYVNEVAKAVNEQNSINFAEIAPGHARLPVIVARLDSTHSKDNIYYATIMVGHCTIDIASTTLSVSGSMEDAEHALFWDMSQRNVAGHPLRVGVNEYHPSVILGMDYTNSIPILVPLWPTSIRDMRWNSATHAIQSTVLPDPEESEWTDKVLFESCDTTAQQSEAVQNASLAYRLSASSVTNPR